MELSRISLKCLGQLFAYEDPNIIDYALKLGVLPKLEEMLYHSPHQHL